MSGVTDLVFVPVISWAVTGLLWVLLRFRVADKTDWPLVWLTYLIWSFMLSVGLSAAAAITLVVFWIQKGA